MYRWQTGNLTRLQRFYVNLKQHYIVVCGRRGGKYGNVWDKHLSLQGDQPGRGTELTIVNNTIIYRLKVNKESWYKDKWIMDDTEIGTINRDDRKGSFIAAPSSQWSKLSFLPQNPKLFSWCLISSRYCWTVVLDYTITPMDFHTKGGQSKSLCSNLYANVMNGEYSVTMVTIKNKNCIIRLYLVGRLYLCKCTLKCLG